MKDKKSFLLITNLTSQMKRGMAVSETLNLLLSANGWKIYTASGKINKLARLFDMLLTTWRYRDEYNCAFIEVFSGQAFIWAEIVCSLLHRLNKPYILGLWGGNLPDFAKRNSRLVDKLLRSATLVVAPSFYLLEKLRPYTSAKITVFPYGVDLSHFQYRIRSKVEPKIISMRGFHSIYCPWIATEVIALLKDTIPGIKLVMTGGDKQDGSLEKTEKIIQEYSLEEVVKVSGFLEKSELERLVMSSDILFNTPIIDNTPVSVIQAMACGLCIVSTNVGGLPYLIDDEVDGLLVPPNNPESIVAAVQRILSEPGLATKLSANAHAKAEQYDWSVILPKWEELLEGVCSSS